MYSGDGYTVESFNDNPRDSVQSIRWMPGQRSSIFAAGGFDGKVRFYELIQSGSRVNVKLQGGVDLGLPVTAIEWAGIKAIFASTADGCLYDINPTNGNKNQFGKADFPVAEMKIYEDSDRAALLVFQLDDTILIHNLKGNDRFPTTRMRAKYTIVCADISQHYLLVGMEGSRLGIIETRDLFGRNPEFSYHESTLISPLTSVSIKHSSEKKDVTFCLSACDGRISILKPSTGGYSGSPLKLNSEITFRAAKLPDNRSNNDTLCHITNVQCITGSDRRLNDLFLACAANGEIKVWDMIKRIDTMTITKNGKDITAARMNDDSSLMAYATGYSWAQGIWGLKDLNYSPEIFVKMIDLKDLGLK